MILDVTTVQYRLLKKSVDHWIIHLKKIEASLGDVLPEAMQAVRKEIVQCGELYDLLESKE